MASLKPAWICANVLPMPPALWQRLQAAGFTSTPPAVAAYRSMLAWRPATPLLAKMDSRAGARPASTPPVGSAGTGPVTGWQLLQTVGLKFASVRMFWSLPAWQVTQFEIDCG